VDPGSGIDFSGFPIPDTTITGTVLLRALEQFFGFFKYLNSMSINSNIFLYLSKNKDRLLLKLEEISVLNKLVLPPHFLLDLGRGKIRIWDPG